MTTTQPPLAAALAETAAAAPVSLAARFDAANRELTASGVAPGMQLAHGPVVLVFYRGDWCPYCNLTLRALQVELGAIQAHGAKLIAVSPQAPDRAWALTEKHELEFSVLSDASQATIVAYGLRYVVLAALQDLYLKFGNDLREQNADGSWNLPVPATFVIDRGRTIRARFVDMDFTKRMEPADVVSALAEINASGR